MPATAPERPGPAKSTSAVAPFPGSDKQSPRERSNSIPSAAFSLNIKSSTSRAWSFPVHSASCCAFSRLSHPSFVWTLILLDRRLVRDGLAVPGTITAKSRTMRNNHSRYKIEFSFQALDATTHARKSIARYDQFHSLHQGQAVTVLYRPESPQRPSVYETSRHRVMEGKQPGRP